MYNLPIPCVILARKNSKGLRNKNRQKIKGISLLEHSILYAKKSKLISHIVVSTDDEKIHKIAIKHNCYSIFPRPRKFSNNTARSEPAIKHALDYFIKSFGEINIYAYLQVTEPFRPKKILDKCIINLIKDKNLESSFAGFKMHKNFWVFKKKFVKINSSSIDYLPRQKRETVFREDTGIALASRYSLIKKGLRVGKKIKIVPYDGVEGLIDIHNKNDLILANKISSIIK